MTCDTDNDCSLKEDNAMASSKWQFAAIHLIIVSDMSMQIIITNAFNVLKWALKINSFKNIEKYLFSKSQNAIRLVVKDAMKLINDKST